MHRQTNRSAAIVRKPQSVLIGRLMIPIVAFPLCLRRFDAVPCTGLGSAYYLLKGRPTSCNSRISHMLCDREKALCKCAVEFV